MSTKALLTEMRDLLKAQVDNVVRNDMDALMAGVERHEQILTLLQTAEVDGTPDELRAIYEEISFQKAKLQSLLESESMRVQFLLQVILGGGPKPPEYPRAQRSPVSARLLNRRT